MSTENSAAFVSRLREAREASGLSQGQVAKKLQMHRPTISEIEAGRRRVTSDELQRFSKLYGVAVDWLIHGSKEPEPADAKLLLAARELAKMSDADLDRLLKTLQMLKKAKPGV